MDRYPSIAQERALSTALEVLSDEAQNIIAGVSESARLGLKALLRLEMLHRVKVEPVLLNRSLGHRDRRRRRRRKAVESCVWVGRV